MRLDIVCFSGNSGVTHYSISLARELNREVEVRILTSDTMEASVRRLFAPILFCFRRTRNLPVDLFRYIRLVLREPPDILLIQDIIKVPLLEILIIRLFQRGGIKCAATVHDVLPHTHNIKPWSRFVFTCYYRAFDQLIAHSEAARRQIIAMGVKKPIAVIPHGVYDIFDLDRLSRAAARQRLGGIAETDCAVLFFGDLVKRKGLFEFVKAAELLSNEPGYRFIIAGKPGLSSAEYRLLEERCRKIGILLDSRLIPFDEVQVYFAAADLIAMPYKEGTTSGILKLALAFGKPVVATPIGDVPETIDPTMGVLVQLEGLPGSLAQGLAAARVNIGPLTVAVKEHGSRFTWSRIASMYLSILTPECSSEKRLNRL